MRSVLNKSAVVDFFTTAAKVETEERRWFSFVFSEALVLEIPT
jgi:hypothetical protein